MPRKTLVREDKQGLYVRSNGSIYRPGNVAGYDHANRMDSAKLKAGEYVYARHVSQSPVCRIVCYENGKPINLLWHLPKESVMTDRRVPVRILGGNSDIEKAIVEAAARQAKLIDLFESSTLALAAMKNVSPVVMHSAPASVRDGFIEAKRRLEHALKDI